MTKLSKVIQYLPSKAKLSSGLSPIDIHLLQNYLREYANLANRSTQRVDVNHNQVEFRKIFHLFWDNENNNVSKFP